SLGEGRDLESKTGGLPLSPARRPEYREASRRPNQRSCRKLPPSPAPEPRTRSWRVLLPNECARRRTRFRPSGLPTTAQSTLSCHLFHSSKAGQNPARQRPPVSYAPAITPADSSATRFH